MPNVYRITGGFVWHKSEGGPGTKFNIGEPVPEKLIENKPVMETLLKSRKIALFDSVSGQKITSEYDYIDLPESDLDYMSRSFGWQTLVDRVAFGNLSHNTLTRLKAKVAVNPSLANKEAVMQAIDNKLKSMQESTKIDSPEEAKTDDKKKNTASK